MKNDEKKVTQEVAEKDVKSWLKFKKVGAKKQEDSRDAIETMISAIVEGSLVYSESNSVFKLTLLHPIKFDDDSSAIDVLTFKPRIKMADIEAKSNNVKAGNGQSLIMSYVCALTDQNSGIIRQLDTEDNRTATAIATFFL